MTFLNSQFGMLEEITKNEIFFKDFIFWERGREVEKHWSVASHTPQLGDLALDIEPVTF